MTSGKKNIVIEQMTIYFLQAVQIDETLILRPRIVRQTRHSAILDYDIYLKLQLVAKATITVKIN